ncbi:hypothetical protein [Cellulosimicrobium cellulans]|uniref:hypothetical protein n=1 Tax=Cellulosimicrobium cellulans TaxID=1710 RepID=UPI001BAAA6EF|nr:hypothetical protein [Cellulosimicrobium cellulans]QUC01109.1 hypothetical protein J5A69_08045 [Cellulosimicrobium cellulans]
MTAKPTSYSPIPAGTDLDPAHLGAKMLGLPLFPQGENVAALILARDDVGHPLYEIAAIQLPRRATKTTSVWATVLGLCATIPNFRVVHTAQTAQIARQKQREIMTALMAGGYEANGTVELRWSNGMERIIFPGTGSVIWGVPPKAAAFRSEAADILLFDEAGEYDPETSEELLGGALPLTDTRPMGQAIITGTPARGRYGLLWDMLEEGRAGDVGILDYSARDDEEVTHLDEHGELQVHRDVLERIHPGIGTLTTYAKIASRLKRMGAVEFEREYAGRFPRDNNVSAISWSAWESCGVQTPPVIPSRVGLAFDVAPDGSQASVTAAWRDDDSRAHVLLLDHHEGTGWIADSSVKASRKRGRSHIGHDTIGANQAVAEALARMRPAPPTKPKTLKEMMSAAQTISREIAAGTLVHYGQPPLDEAVRGAAWRDVQNSGRLFARKKSASDVSPVVSASIALHTYDAMPARAGGVVFA